MISHKHKFIFIHIPKTGGTSIERLFVDHETDRMLGGKDVEYKHDSARQMQETFPKKWEQYFTFTVVRNTWDWIISRFYWHYFFRPQDLDRLLIPTHKDRVIEGSFRKFVMSLDDMLKKKEGRHLELDTQLSRLLDINGEVSLDYVCKFESLQVDFDHVCNKAGISQQKLPHIHKTKHKHYTEYYDEEMREIVAKKYAKDIEYFGYKFGE